MLGSLLPPRQRRSAPRFFAGSEGVRILCVPAQKIAIPFGYPLWTAHASPRDTCSIERVSSEEMRRLKKLPSGQSCAVPGWEFPFGASTRSAPSSSISIEQLQALHDSEKGAQAPFFAGGEGGGATGVP